MAEVRHIETHSHIRSKHLIDLIRCGGEHQFSFGTSLGRRGLLIRRFGRCIEVPCQYQRLELLWIQAERILKPIEVEMLSLSLILKQWIDVSLMLDIRTFSDTTLDFQVSPKGPRQTLYFTLDKTHQTCIFIWRSRIIWLVLPSLATGSRRNSSLLA